MSKSLYEQVDTIRLLKIHEHLDICLRCGLQGVFMYSEGEYSLCPSCDIDLIDEYKQKEGSYE